MKKNKLNLLYSIGTVGAIALPIAAVISCGTTKAKKAGDTKGTTTPNINNKDGDTKGTTTPNINNKDGDTKGTTTPNKNNINKKDGTDTNINKPGTNTQEQNQKVLDNKGKIKYGGVIKSSEPKVISKTFGDGNFAIPKATYASNTRNTMENKNRKVTGQPYTLHYHARDLETWKAGKDADDAFNVATVPLKDRTLAGKILASQKEKQLQILGCLTHDTSYTPLGTTSKEDTNNKIFQMWSKVTSFVGWGGSSGEGNFIIPKGDDINAAHRNGVPLLGTLFLPEAGDGGDVSVYAKLSKKVDGKFPVADNMIAMAKHFGFDGWFLNFETNYKMDANMHEFMKYFHDKMQEQKLFTVLYDAGVGVDFMKDGSNQPFDEAAFDYGNWDKSYAVSEEKRSYGYNYDVSITGESKDYIDKNDRNLWLYTYFKRHDVIDGDKTDLELFSDKDGSGDPRSHMDAAGKNVDPTYKTKNEWTGLSKYFQAHTTINTREEFSTSFETGIGSSFYINGKSQKLGTELATNGYRNQGIQDVLPTYTWINDEYKSDSKFDDANRVSTPGESIVNDGATWKVQLDETGTPVYGSTNLHYTGKISAGQTMVNRLYGSDVSLKTGDKFSVVVNDENAKNTGLAIWVQDKYDATTVQEHVSKVIDPTKAIENLGNGLSKLTYEIPADIDGKVMSSFGLAFTNKEANTLDVNCHIGQLTYSPVDAKPKTENWITSLTQDGNFLFQNERNVRINWEMQDKSTVDHYVVWSTNGKDRDDFTKKDILTVTSLPAAYLKNVAHKKDLNIVIDAVGLDNEIITSNRATVKTSFEAKADLSKWTESFERESGASAEYTLGTKDEYTTSFKDSDGNLYIGDASARIHKIAKDGSLKTNGNDDWGKHISRIFKDVKVEKIWEYDQDNIGALTQDGIIHVINKETGSQTSKLNESIQEFMKTINVKSIERIKFFDSKDGAITLIADTDVDGTNLNVRIDDKGIATEIPNQTGTSKVIPDVVTRNSDGTIEVGYTQNGDVAIKEFAAVTDIDFSALSTSTSKISTTFETYETQNLATLMGMVESKGFEQPSIMASYRGPNSTPDGLIHGKIVLARKLKNGDTLVINEWGVAVLLASDGSKKGVTSIVEGKVLYDIVANAAKITDAKHWGPGDKITKTFADLTKPVDGIFDGLIKFDEDTGTLQYIQKYDVEYREWEDGEKNTNGLNGHLVPLTKLVSVDLTEMTKFNSGPPLGVPKSISETVFSTDADKTVGTIVFIDKISGMFIIGGKDGKLGIYDKDMKQLSVGQKIYSYDGTVDQTIDRIYDDKDQTIPPEYVG